MLPPGHDPDSFIFEFGAAAVQKAAAEARGIMPFLMEAAVVRHGLSVDGKVQIVFELSAAIAAIQDPVGPIAFIKDLAERVQVDEGAILERVRSRVVGRDRRRRQDTTGGGGRPGWRPAPRPLRGPGGDDDAADLSGSCRKSGSGSSWTNLRTRRCDAWVTWPCAGRTIRTG